MSAEWDSELPAAVEAAHADVSRASRYLRELRAVSNCLQTVLRADNETALLNDICRIVCEDAGYRMAWVGFREDDETRKIRPVSWDGVEDGFLADAYLTWSETDPKGHGLSGTAIRTGNTTCVQDFSADPRAGPWRDQALARGYHSGIALPLRDDNQYTFGVIVICSTQRNAFTPNEVRLLEDLAGSVAFGITGLRARAARKHLELERQSALHFFASMDRINVAMQDNDDLERMLTHVLDVVMAIFGCDRTFLLYPCDLDAASWRVPMERNRPEFPGALTLGLELPVDGELLNVFRIVLSHPGALSFGAGTERSVPKIARDHAVQSMILMAIYPKGDKPYMFGVHQCRFPRVWTREEEKLFQEIGRRMADGLSSLLAHRELRQNETRLRAVMQTIPDLVWLKDLGGTYVACNRQVERLLGATEAEIIGRTDYDFFPREVADFFRDHDRKALAAGKPCVNEEWLTFVDGGYHGLFETVKTTMRDHAGVPSGVVGISRDITERHRAEEQRRVTATAFEAQEGIVIADARKAILKVNRAFSEITGYASTDAVGQALHMLWMDHGMSINRQLVLEALESAGSWQGEIRSRRRSGTIFPAWVNITAVKDDRGEITHYVLTMVDITARKAAEREIEQLAYYDPLTQLPNRRLLMDRLQRALASLAQSHLKGALLFIDLDHFKILNDTIGHDVGDRLLCSVAARLTSSVREGDTIARLGGDEFVVMLENLGQGADEAVAQARRTAEQILAVLNRPYTIGKRVLHSTPSIGVALFSDSGSSVDELVRQADIAMYQAKAAGRNTLRFFDPDMQAALAARVSLEAELRSGIQRREFLLHYQSQVHGLRGIVGAEALVRWQHPERGLIPPAEFIPLAEETGLILEIGHWVLEEACRQLKSWSANLRTHGLYLAINVSARQFRQPDFVAQVAQALQRAGAPADRLKIELTETLVLDDIEDTIRKMGQLRQLGVGFCMDDFGTGYSSLSYLTRLPLDQIKIDRSFVQNLPHSANDAIVVQTIITMARSLGLTAVAEGVETEAQREFLVRNGCPACQGYLFGRPVPLLQFEELTLTGRAHFPN